MGYINSLMKPVEDGIFLLYYSRISPPVPPNTTSLPSSFSIRKMQASFSRRRALVEQGYNRRVEKMRKEEYPQLRSQ